MNFKLFLAIGAFVGLFALSTATTAPASEKNYMLSGLKKLLASPPKIQEAEDASKMIYAIRQAWMAFVMVTTLDNVKFFESTTTIPTGPGKYSQLEFRNTHLRGLHRLEQNGPATIEYVLPNYIIVNFTAASNALEFHSEMVETNNDGSSTGMRSLATFKNLNLHMEVHINFTEGTFPFSFKEVHMVGTPELSVWGKTLNSQWGDAPAGKNGIIMAKVVEHLKKTHIPLLLRNLFSQKTVAAVNQAMKNADRKSRINSEVGPTWLYDDLAFIWFYGYRSEMCGTYKLDLNHTLEFGQPGTDRITVKNGAIRGLDYIRRTECGDLESCTHVPCPRGSFIFDYDDIYIDYDIQADWNGRSSQGKMTVTISGLQEKDNHVCVQRCGAMPWFCDTVPERESAEFTKLGKVLVDVKGLPEELHPRHRDLIEFAEVIRAKLLRQIIAGSYGDSHFDNANCIVA